MTSRLILNLRTATSTYPIVEIHNQSIGINGFGLSMAYLILYNLEDREVNRTHSLFNIRNDISRIGKKTSS